MNLKIAIAQINPTIGDIKGNTEKIISYINKARKENCDLIVFPELSILGYPPRDLLFRAELMRKIDEVIYKKILLESKDLGILLGAPLYKDGNIYNSALLFYKEKLFGYQYKTLLPSYDVFDETRYFKPAEYRHPILFKGINLGVTICEDIWNDKDYWNRTVYEKDPVEELISQGAEIIINLSASPYYFGKMRLRVDMLSYIAKKYKRPIVYVNQVGGNDELIFDGSSLVITEGGKIYWEGKNFEEDFGIIDFSNLFPVRDVNSIKEDIESIYKALILGIKDYFSKLGFKKAVIGLSGGIDSSVVACLATYALGAENVLGVSMPSRYSSEGSVKDAEILARNLGIEFRIIPIEKIFKSYLETLNPNESPLMDLAEENIQARIRGNILMFISNREGHLVLTTGNKSELAVGYCTLYGDMAGGLAVIGDLPKMMVYELARFINREKEIIPRSILTKIPSAELRPNQKDEDSLPPYPILDQILKAYIEDNLSIDEIKKMGFEKDLVEEVVKKIDNAEYKRRQAPPVLKVTTKAFGMGRRMPIAWKKGW
ncbi:MAG: NAD+ synthase [Dictyoglomus sp.]|nr:NAD+ synthase [Dictyoglomus sp.]MDW8188022.1 NAD+ synthase [Dictyoglomus sp.]